MDGYTSIDVNFFGLNPANVPTIIKHLQNHWAVEDAYHHQNKIIYFKIKNRKSLALNIFDSMCDMDRMLQTQITPDIIGVDHDSAPRLKCIN